MSLAPPDGDNSQLAHVHAALNSRPKVVLAAHAIYEYHRLTGRMHYTQDARRMSIVRHKWRPPFHDVLEEDCSSFATACYWLAACADPNGYGYNGLGWTGSLCQHGKPVKPDKARPGDLYFYGDGPPWSHVVVGAGGGKGYSHGSEGGPRVVDVNYRPIGQIRSYLR